MPQDRIDLVDKADDEAAIKRAKKIAKQGEKGPSTALQTDSYQFFQEQVAQVGTPYDVTHIPIDVLKQMQRDPMIGLGLHFKRVPLIRARWHIASERADIASFVDHALREIYPRLVAQFYRSRTFGFSPVVKRFELTKPDWTYLDPTKSDDEIKVWDNGNVEALTWKEFTPLPCDPAYTLPKFNSKGEFDGIEYDPTFAVSAFPFKSSNGDDKKQHIPVTHSLWFTNERDSVDGSIYGYPAVAYAYRAWWSYWYRWALYDRFFERKADAPLVSYYPDGSAEGDHLEGPDGSVGDSNQQMAIMLAASAKSGGAVALPSKTYTDAEDKPGSVREWALEELQVTGDMSHFVDSFEYLDVQKIRGLFVPEEAIIEGSKGQSSRNVAGSRKDAMVEAQASEIDELDAVINNFIIPDLVRVNFPDFKGSVRKVTTGFSEADTDVLADLLRTLSQKENGPDFAEVDVAELLDRLGVPILSNSIVQDREKKAMAEVAKLGPELVVAKPGESAGVKEGPDGENLYYQPRGVIKMADDQPFLDSLPDIKVYNDPGVRAAARQINGLWKEGLGDAYSEFADYLRTVDLSDLSEEEIKLAEIDPESLVGRIVNGWEFSRGKLKGLSERTTDIIKRVMGVAARRELRRIRRNPEWSPDTDEIVKYLEDRGALYVKAIDETTRKELGSFLGKGISDGKTMSEIADEIPFHFTDFPKNRANRIVRSEIRDAYNVAMLTAGEQAGIRTVQAHDALLGDTDPTCMERDGKFFTIGEALAEALSEHPFGTLNFTFSNRDNLSEQIVEKMPEGHKDELAYFDENNAIIYLHTSISASDKTDYLKTLGAIFENE